MKVINSNKKKINNYFKPLTQQEKFDVQNNLWESYKPKYDSDQPAWVANSASRIGKVMLDFNDFTCEWGGLTSGRPASFNQLIYTILGKLGFIEKKNFDFNDLVYKCIDDLKSIINKKEK